MACISLCFIDQAVSGNLVPAKSVPAVREVW